MVSSRSIVSASCAILITNGSHITMFWHKLRNATASKNSACNFFQSHSLSPFAIFIYSKRKTLSDSESRTELNGCAVTTYHEFLWYRCWTNSVRLNCEQLQVLTNLWYDYTQLITAKEQKTQSRTHINVSAILGIHIWLLIVFMKNQHHILFI